MSVVGHLRSVVLRYRKTCLAANSPKKVELLSDRIRETSVWRMSSFQFSSVDDLKVEFNPKRRQFFIKLGKDKALLEYRDVIPGVVDLFHTEVPKHLEGKGIAKLLAKEAFDSVVKNNQKMIVSCPYLQKYLKDNPKSEYLNAVYESKH